MKDKYSVKAIDDIGIQRVLIYGSFLTSIAFLRSGTDPVNLPKFTVLVATGTSLLVLILSSLRNVWNSGRATIILGLGFIFSILIPVISSGAPLSHQLFGVQGRNIGFLTYLMFVTVFISGSILTSKSSVKKVTNIFLACSLLNVLAIVFEKLGVSFLNANNVFGGVLGLLGNPNFVSSFLGVSTTLLLSHSLQTGLNSKRRFFFILLILIQLSLMHLTFSKQGYIVVIFGSMIITLFYIWKKKKAIKSTIFVVAIFTATLCLGVMALLNTGPLAKIIYESTISYRIQYWHAGLVMFFEHPITGVGLGAFGDWYRFSRSTSAIQSPGPEVVTNAAHNIYIDLLAQGGIFAFLTFVALLTYIGAKSIRRLVVLHQFNALYVGIFAAWVGLLLQSAISIDQIGLSIWTWIFGGLLLSLSRFSDSELDDEATTISVSKRKAEPHLLMEGKTVILIFIGSIIGLTLGSQPLINDQQVGSALRKSSVEALTSAANRWPRDSQRMAYSSFTLIQNKLYLESYALAKNAVKLNSRDFNSWRLIFENTSVPVSERNFALQKMKFLDPKNPGILKLKSLK